MNQKSKLTCVVLGGGKSSRMGQDKTKMTIDGETMMARTVRKLRAVSDDIIIAGNSTAKYGLADTREVEDTFPNCGPMGGIHAALQAAKYDVAFVCAGDMPHFSVEIIDHLYPYLAEGYALVLPVLRGRGEPLCALYTKACLEPLAATVAEGNFRLNTLSSRVRSHLVSEEELAKKGLDLTLFYNMNTMEDYVNAANRGTSDG